MNEIDEFTEPELYDIFNNNCIEDILWYIKYCKKYISILELGVGTGRIAIPLAQNGHRVWGIDNSVDMLRLLRQKINSLNIEGIHIIEQNICDLKINRTFDIALVPFCTFNFLLSKEEQRAALVSLKECLAPNAVGIFELMTLNTFCLQNGSSEFVFYRSFNTGLKNIEIYIKNDYEIDSKILKQNRLIKIYDNKGNIDEKNLVMKNRIISVEEFEELLRICGYEIQNIYGSFDNEPFSKDSKSLIVIVRKKSD